MTGDQVAPGPLRRRPAPVPGNQPAGSPLPPSVRRLAWLLVLASGPALADDDANGISRHAASRWEQDGPLLHLDSSLPVATEGLGADEDHETHLVELGRHTRVTTAARWWQAGLAPGSHTGRDVAIVARGWQTGAELSHDLGGFRLGASAAAGQVDSRFERGTYTDVALSIGRRVQLSRWLHGWLSLGLATRRWSSSPPPGEASATTVLLSFRTMWR